MSDVDPDGLEARAIGNAKKEKKGDIHVCVTCLYIYIIIYII